jgi:hypothetical protein
MAIRHAKAGEVVDLRPLGQEWKHTETTAIVKSDAFEAVRLIVRKATDISPHQVRGAMMLHCLEGRVLLGFASSCLELCSGQWIYLAGGEGTRCGEYE